MNAIKDFFSKKSIGYYIFAGSALLGLLTLIIYTTRNGDVLTKLEPAAITLLIVGVVLNILLLIKNIKPLELVPFILYLSAFAVFMSSEITFIGNVANGVDGNVFDAGFMMIAIFGVLSVVLGMIACIMKFNKK